MRRARAWRSWRRARLGHGIVWREDAVVAVSVVGYDGAIFVGDEK